MSRSEEQPEEVSVASDAPTIAAPADRLYALLSGHFAGGYDAAAARLTMDRKRRIWLERRGRLDGPARTAIDSRIAAGQKEARSRLNDLGRAAAMPVPKRDAMAVSGRVVKDGNGQPDLTVSALDRSGKALTCGKTGGGGIFRLELGDGEEAILMVAGAKGEPLRVDDRVIKIERGGSAYRLLDLSAGSAGKCPDGPDLSGRAVMPDLVGMPLEQARQEARKAKVAIADVKLKPSQGPEHVVLSTDPPAGRLLPDPARCSLVISAPRQKEPDIRTVGAVMKAQDSVKVADHIVDRLIEGVGEAKAEVADDLRKLAKATDRTFAAITGVPREDATLVRRSLDAVLKQLHPKKG